MRDVKQIGLPCIMYGDIYVKYDTHFKKCNYHIDSVIAKNSVKASPQDLFFTASGETADDIGRCVSYQGEDDIYIGGDIIALHPSNEYDSLFLAYVQNSENVKRQKASFAQGHSVVHISVETIKKTRFALPKYPEQRRIAEALSDVDELIASLEKLIEKKKALKQGVMQELLTGKRRLPGFTGEWITSNQLFEVVKGEQINGSELQEDLPYPLYNGGVSASGYTLDYNYENRVIISEGGNSCGYINYIKTKFWAGGHCYVVVNAKVLNDYLYQLLKLHETNIMALRVGSGLPNIQKEELKKLRFSYPKETEEQQAIVKILYDIDLGIRRLTDKLDKVHKIKSGMMSELLTGRIRLV